MANYFTSASDRSKSVAKSKCLWFGWLGAHLYYVGRVGEALRYTFFGLTLAIIGFGCQLYPALLIMPLVAAVDLYHICIGDFRDNVGAPLRED